MREDVHRALEMLKDDHRFSVVLQYISWERDRSMKACIAASTQETAEPYRLEVRAFDRIINTLTRSGLRAQDEQRTSGG